MGTTAGRATATTARTKDVVAAPAYVPNEVVVRYSAGPLYTARARLRTMGVRASADPAPEPSTSVLRLPAGETVTQAIARLRGVPESPMRCPTTSRISPVNGSRTTRD